MDGLRKALAKYKDIDLKKIYSNNRDIAWGQINNMYYCFDVGVSDEGFSLMGQINSLPINSSQLVEVKSSLWDRF